MDIKTISIFPTRGCGKLYFYDLKGDSRLACHAFLKPYLY
jgi:hypothetical protein